MISSKADTTFVAMFPLYQDNESRYKGSNFHEPWEYTRQPVYDIISIVRIQYYTETVIQIFKTYTGTRVRCYIVIFSQIHIK